MAATTFDSTANLNNNLSHLSNDFKSSLDNYLQYQKGLALLNNRYSFISNLQTGSFGKVTSALDVKLDQKVAIKALKKSVSGVSLMANHEVSIMRSLGYHRNITQLIDFFETKKYYVLVLEFADSGDLYDAIHNKTNLGINFQTNHLAFADLCSQLYEVIAYSHSKGVYHRDIKPENILLMNDGTIKLCDWGLSTKILKSNDYNVGTEKYMAPEALAKSNPNDYYLSDLVDVYSIGITLLFTLFNKCPFRKALNTDPNYSSFLKSKSFIYDFFTSINTVSFRGIVDLLIIERDLNGLKFLIENGMKNGFTIDQEYSISFSKQQNNYINSIVDSFNDTKIENESNENEVFLFDDYDTLNEDDFINEHVLNDCNINDSSSKSNSNYVHNSSVNPISIPIPNFTSNTSSNIAGSMMNSSSTYNPSSLFDSNVQKNNSFINSFEMSNDAWCDQISDLRFKFQ
ncbi:hypothetical protein PMKS-002548 [Pichia membranifaciens]|uniref:non-specific serine/threonine protein kinase n=1 Tax=Pichia membranifaciens TaxID=4926 RepID=A0A1Q2YHR4_9ASCO|nr:hypothetical protein PMKS-002548 [Pichia membranifaciens]